MGLEPLPAGRLVCIFARGTPICRQDLGGCAAAGRHLCTHTYTLVHTRAVLGEAAWSTRRTGRGPVRAPCVHPACLARGALALLLDQGLCSVWERLPGRPTADRSCRAEDRPQAGFTSSSALGQLVGPFADVTWTPLSGLVYLGGGQGARPQPVFLPPPHCCPQSLLSSGLTLRPSSSRRGCGGPSGARGPLPEAALPARSLPEHPDSWCDPGGPETPAPIDRACLSAQSSGPSESASWHCGPSGSGSGTSSHHCGTCCGATPSSSRRPMPSAWSSRRRWAGLTMPRPRHAMPCPATPPPRPCSHVDATPTPHPCHAWQAHATPLPCHTTAHSRPCRATPRHTLP